MKTVYAHDMNGFYQGEMQAQPHPFQPGEYLMPAYCVDVAPPEVPNGKKAQWSNDAWALVDDPQIAIEVAIAAEVARLSAEEAARAAGAAAVVEAAENTQALSELNAWGVPLNEMVNGHVIPRPQSIVDAESIPAAWSRLRSQRDSLLSASDYSQLADSPMSQSEKTAYAAYRQMLRDLPENTADPKNPGWPVKP